MAQSAVPVTEYKTEFVPTGAKAAVTATGAKKIDDAVMVPLDKLTVPGGLNVRIHNAAYEARIDEIADSISQNGFFKWMPLKGYPGKEGDQSFIYVTGGFTRLEAAKRAAKRGAPIEAVPVILTPPGTSMADLTLGIAMDNTGAPLKPYERGVIVKRLIGYGWDEKTIADKMTVSLNYVKDLLYLMGLPMPLQQMVIDDQASAGHVIGLAKQGTPTKALESLREAVAKAEVDDAPVGSENKEGVDTGGTEGRVRPKRTKKLGVISKKIVMAAIDYAIALPGDGIEFLSRWRKGEKDALAEVEATLKRPKQKASKPPAKAKGGGKAGGKRTKGGKASDAPGTAAAAPAGPPSAAEVQTEAERAMGKAADKPVEVDL